MKKCKSNPAETTSGKFIYLFLHFLFVYVKTIADSSEALQARKHKVNFAENAIGKFRIKEFDLKFRHRHGHRPMYFQKILQKFWLKMAIWSRSQIEMVRLFVSTI